MVYPIKRCAPSTDGVMMGCAPSTDDVMLGRAYSEYPIWLMVTINRAKTMALEAFIPNLFSSIYRLLLIVPRKVV